MKATRSRCFGSMFAWILNTKPEKFGASGAIGTPWLRRGAGGAECSTKPSRSNCTPKLLSALPK